MMDAEEDILCFVAIGWDGVTELGWVGLKNLWVFELWRMAGGVVVATIWL